MSHPDPDLRGDLARAIRGKARTFRWLGIVLIVLGAVAILFPLVATIAAKVMVGWLFVATGAVTLWHAFQARDWSPAILSGLVGVLHLAVGVYLAFFPLTGLIALTVLLALVFLVQGGIELGLAWRHRPGHGLEGPVWAWMAVSGAVTVILGVALLAGLPGTALWAIGLILGINFLTTGISFLTLASAARRL